MKTEKAFAEIQVAEIMTRHVHALMVNDTIKDAVTLMLDHELSALPIVDAHNKCVGILSRSDLTEFFLNEDNELARVLDAEQFSLEWFSRSLETSGVRQVNEMMTFEVAQIREDQKLSEACREMTRKRIHHLPVTDSEGRVAGIISTFDVVAAIAELA